MSANQCTLPQSQTLTINKTSLILYMVFPAEYIKRRTSSVYISMNHISFIKDFFLEGKELMYKMSIEHCECFSKTLNQKKSARSDLSFINKCLELWRRGDGKSEVLSPVCFRLWRSQKNINKWCFATKKELSTIVCQLAVERGCNYFKID